MKKLKFDIEIKQLGQVIKELRVKSKITQEHLSTLCDVDVRTIQRIEKGQQNISINLLFTISEVLNVKPDVLISRVFSEN